MFTKSTYRLPAEWEPQSGVQLTWPHEGTDWAPMLDEITETYRQMADAIRRYEPVLIVEPPSNDTWARDHGFITLVPHDPDLSPRLKMQRFCASIYPVRRRLPWRSGSV